MSLRDALLKNKQRLDEMKVEMKIQKMLDEQKRLLNVTDGVVEEINTEVTKKPKKVVKQWDESILGDKGGISHYILDNKWYKVANTGVDCDITLKFHIRTSVGSRFSVSAKSYSEAQAVVDSVFGKGLYSVSASLL